MDYLLGLTDEKMSYASSGRTRNPVISEESKHYISYWIFKSGYSREEVALKLGIDIDCLENYISGKSDMPLSILKELSEICNVSTDCILGFREKSRPAGSDGTMPFQFDPEISRRLKEQAKQMGEINSFLADILEINEEEIFNFFEYGFVPHVSVFAQIVEYFFVSSDYLLNRTDCKLTTQKKRGKSPPSISKFKFRI